MSTSAALPPGAILSLHCLEAPRSCARQHHANSQRVLSKCLLAGARHINSCSTFHRAITEQQSLGGQRQLRPSTAIEQNCLHSTLPGTQLASATVATKQHCCSLRVKCTCLQELGPLEGSPPMLDKAQAPASRNGLHVPRRGLWQVPHWGDWSCWSCATRSTRLARMLAPERVCARAGCFQGSMHVLVSRITAGC